MRCVSEREVQADVVALGLLQFSTVAYMSLLLLLALAPRKHEPRRDGPVRETNEACTEVH